MKEKIGTLHILASGRWCIVYADGDAADEITSGDQFYLEVSGTGSMELTRMEYQPYKYYSIDGYTLKPGLKASYVGNRFWT